MTFHSVCQDALLDLRAVLEELLNYLNGTHQQLGLVGGSAGTYIVSKYVLDQLECRIGHDLIEHDLLFVA